MVATCVADMQLAEEIHMTGILEPIHKTTKYDGTEDNGTEI